MCLHSLGMVRRKTPTFLPPAAQRLYQGWDLVHTSVLNHFRYYTFSLGEWPSRSAGERLELFIGSTVVRNGIGKG